MDNHSSVRRAFGVDEYGFADLPHKIGNRMISRIVASNEGECGYCFPGGVETRRWSARQNTRSWKNYREKQYRTKE